MCGNDDIHTHNTRLKESIHLYRPSTDFGKCSLKFRASAKYYDDLPEEIKFKLDDSERYNKSVLKTYLLNIDLTSFITYIVTGSLDITYGTAS